MLMKEWGVLALYEELCIRYNTRYPLSAHIYANDKSCYICGHEYKSVIVIRNDTEPLIDLLINVRGLPETLEAGEEVSLIAALYADGRLVGMEQKTVTVRSDLSVQQSLELSFGASYAPDRCQVFLLDDLTSAPLTSSQTANID